MSLPDTNAIIRAYLLTQTPLTNLVGQRIHCPRLPENAVLPAIGFFIRGGSSDPYIPDIPRPSVQFDCWAKDLITARNVYRKLYDALQGIQDVVVAVGGTDYRILSAREEVQGQDLPENEIPHYHRVLTFFEIQIS